jgi:hypothetical protein
MGRSQRDKGKRGERRAVRLLSKVYPDARRSANQAGGPLQPDVEGTPWWVEAKEGAAPRIWAAYAQAEDERQAAGSNKPPLVIAHKTNGPTLATLGAKHFIRLLLLLEKLMQMVRQYEQVALEQEARKAMDEAENG